MGGIFVGGIFLEPPLLHTSHYGKCYWQNFDLTFGKGPVKLHLNERAIFLELHVFRGVEQEYEISFWWLALEN